MGQCKNCRHFDNDSHMYEDRKVEYGSCLRWKVGYDGDKLVPGEIVLTLEGFGAVMSPTFGCMLFEQKRVP